MIKDLIKLPIKPSKMPFDILDNAGNLVIQTTDDALVVPFCGLINAHSGTLDLDVLYERYKNETGASVFATNLFKDWLKNNLQNGIVADKWINVEDRLPEIGEGVLAYCKSQGVQMCHRGYVDKKNVWVMSFDLSFANLNITHWQLLPELPKL